MVAPAYCPSCGRAQVADAKFCSGCGQSFEATAAGSPQQGLAAGLLVVQNLWLKLVVGRVIGLVAGLAIWWFVAGPMLNGDFFPTIIAFFALAFGGVLVGQTLVLQSVAGRR